MARAAITCKVEPFAARPERQNFFALGQRFEQIILPFIGGAIAATLHTEHAFELAFAEVSQRAAPRTLK